MMLQSLDVESASFQEAFNPERTVVLESASREGMGREGHFTTHDNREVILWEA